MRRSVWPTHRLPLWLDLSPPGESPTSHMALAMPISRVECGAPLRIAIMAILTRLEAALGACGCSSSCVGSLFLAAKSPENGTAPVADDPERLSFREAIFSLKSYGQSR